MSQLYKKYFFDSHTHTHIQIQKVKIECGSIEIQKKMTQDCKKCISPPYITSKYGTRTHKTKPKLKPPPPMNFQPKNYCNNYVHFFRDVYTPIN